MTTMFIVVLIPYHNIKLQLFSLSYYVLLIKQTLVNYYIINTRTDLSRILHTDTHARTHAYIHTYKVVQI